MTKHTPNPRGASGTASRSWNYDSPVARIAARATVAEIDEALSIVGKQLLQGAARLKASDKPVLVARRGGTYAQAQKRMASLMAAKSIILGRACL